MEYSKILRETTRFAEMLENINKISISMIQPVKSSFALPLVTPRVANFHYDINTQPSPFSQEDNLEEICQQFDITEFLAFNFSEETSDQSMFLYNTNLNE